MADVEDANPFAEFASQTPDSVEPAAQDENPFAEFATEAPAGPTPPGQKKPELDPSMAGTFARRIAPAAVDLTGGLGGAAAGGALGTAAFPGVGTLVGALAGMFGGAWLTGKVREKLTDMAGLREGTGYFSEAAEQADYQQNPKTALAADLSAALLAFRSNPLAGGEAATSAVGKMLQNNPRKVGAALMGTFQAGQEAITQGHVDPIDVAMAAAVGGALPHARNWTNKYMGAVEEATTGVMQKFRPGRPDEAPSPTTERDKAANDQSSVTPNQSMGNAPSKEPPKHAGEYMPDPAVGNPQSAPSPSEVGRDLRKTDAPKESGIPAPGSLIPDDMRQALGKALGDNSLSTRTIEPNDKVTIGGKPVDAGPPYDMNTGLPRREPPKPVTEPVTQQQWPIGSMEPRGIIEQRPPVPKEKVGGQSKVEPAQQKETYREPTPEHEFGDAAIEHTRTTGEYPSHIQAIDDATKAVVADVLKRHGIEDHPTARDTVEKIVKRHAEELVSDDAFHKEMLESISPANRALVDEAIRNAPKIERQAPATVEGTIEKLVQYGMANEQKQAHVIADRLKGMPDGPARDKAAENARKWLSKRPGKGTVKLENDRGAANTQWRAQERNKSARLIQDVFEKYAPQGEETVPQMRNRLERAVKEAWAQHGKGTSPTKTDAPRVKYREWLWLRRAEDFIGKKNPSEQDVQNWRADERLARGSDRDVDTLRQNRRAEFEAKNKFKNRTDTDAAETAIAKKEGAGNVEDQMVEALDKKRANPELDITKMNKEDRDAVATVEKKLELNLIETDAEKYRVMEEDRSKTQAQKMAEQRAARLAREQQSKGFKKLSDEEEIAAHQQRDVWADTTLPIEERAQSLGEQGSRMQSKLKVDRENQTINDGYGGTVPYELAVPAHIAIDAALKQPTSNLTELQRKTLTALRGFYGDTEIFIISGNADVGLTAGSRFDGLYMHENTGPQSAGSGSIVLKSDMTGHFETVLLHELVHRATLHDLIHNPEARKFIIQFMDEARNALEAKGFDLGMIPGGEGGANNNPRWYGFTAPWEFVAEIGSNKVLERDLRSIPASKELTDYVGLTGGEHTMWDTIKGWYAKVLDLPQTPEVHNMLDVMLKYMEKTNHDYLERTIKYPEAVSPVTMDLLKEINFRSEPSGADPNPANMPKFEEIRERMFGAVNNTTAKMFRPENVERVMNIANAKFDTVKRGLEKYLGIPMTNEAKVAEQIMAEEAASKTKYNTEAVHALDERWMTWLHLDKDKALRAQKVLTYLDTLEKSGMNEKIAQLEARGISTPQAERMTKIEFADEVRARLIDSNIDHLEKYGKMARADAEAQVAKVPNSYWDVQSRWMADEALLHRKQMDKLWEWDRLFGSEAAYREDYVAHLFKDQEKANRFIQSRVDALGPTWYQKARMFDFIKEAVAAGHELRYKNPIDIVQARWMASVNANLKVAALRKMQEQGIAVPKRDASEWQKQAWKSHEFYAGDHNYWLIEPNAMQIFQNAVSKKSLYTNPTFVGSIFRGWMQVKNVWMPIQLGLSAFHYLHIVASINPAENITRAIRDSMRDGNWASNLAEAGKLSLTQPLFNLPLDKIGKGFGKRLDDWAGNKFSQARGRSIVDWWKWSDEKLAEPANAEAKFWVDVFREGGMTPGQPWQEIIGAKRQLHEAMHDQEYVKTIPTGIRRAVEISQEWLFKHFVPQIKNEQYMRGVAAIMADHPELVGNPAARQRAFQQLARNLHDRYGEMFYNAMFWNKYLKEVGIASSVSLSWNVGQFRQAGGAIKDIIQKGTGQSRLQKEAWETNNRGTFVATYAAFTMGFAGMMSYALSGEIPSGLDYFFPRTGLKNADGSPARVTTPFNTREIPMAIGHAQEHGSWAGGIGNLLYNKTILQPVVEWWQNRDFFGREMFDTNANLIKRSLQTADSILGAHLNPISITGASRAAQTPGAGKRETALAWAGFGPAPKYVDHSATENRITKLFHEHVQSASHPYEYGEKTGLGRGLVQGTARAIAGDKLTSETRLEERAKLANANTAKDPDAANEARRKLVVEGGLSKQTVKKLNPREEMEYRFARLPIEDQRALSSNMSGDEFNRFVMRNHLMSKQSRFRLVKERNS